MTFKRTFTFILWVPLSFFACFASANNTEYEKALESFHNANYSETIIHLKNSLKNNLEHIPSRILLAKTLLAQGNGDAAEVELLDLQGEGVDINQLVTLLAEALILQDKYDEALEIASEGYRGKGIESQILFLRGQAHLGLNQMRLADDAFTDALNLSPNFQKAKLGKAQVAVRQNNLSLAMRYIDDALDSFQESSNAWIMKSVVAQMQGNLDLALSAVTEAIFISPEHLQARLSRASINYSLEDYSSSLSDLDFVLGEIPEEPRAKFLKAIVNSALGDEESRQKNLNEVMVTLSAVPPEVMQNNPAYFYLAGVTSFQFGNLEEAKAYLQSYLRIMEKDLDTLELLATIELKQGDSEAAKNILTKANVYFPNEPKILTLLAISMAELGNIRVADRYFAQVADILPTARQAQVNLARNKMMSENYLAAIDILLSLEKQTDKVNNVDTELLLLEAYLQTREYTKAIAVSFELVKEFPNSSFFAQKHGVSLGFAGKIAESKEYLNKAVTLTPGNIEAAVHLARIDVIEGKQETALKRIEALLLANPKNIALTIELADMKSRVGEFEQGHLLYEKALSFDSLNEHALQKLVTSFVRRGEDGKAIELLIDFTQKSPKAFKSRMTLGKLFLRVNQPRKAIESLSTTVTSMQDRVPAYLLLSQAFMVIEDRSSAIKSLNKAIAWDEQRIEPLLALFPIVVMQEDFQRAEQVIYSMNKLIPDSVLVEQYSAKLAMKRGYFIEAEKHFRNAFQREPKSQMVLGLYHSLIAQKKYKKAQLEVLNWLSVEPNDVILELALVESYELTGDGVKVLPYYENLLDKYKRMPLLLNNAASAYFDAGEKVKAHKLALEAFEKAPENVNVIDTLAWIESRLGNNSVAISLFREALVVDYSNPYVKYHLAQTLKQENRDKEAQKMLIDLLNNDRKFSERAAAEALLKEWRVR